MVLNTQISNFDSGPTCLMNSLKMLYNIDEIPIKLLKIIYFNSLDSKDSYMYDNGTSRAAMKRICNKFNIYGLKHNMDIFYMYYAKNEVNMDIITNSLNAGKILIIRNNFENENYFMITKIKKNMIYIFDPSINDSSDIYNIEINIKDLNTTKNIKYSLGPIDTRELIIASKYC